MSRVDAINLALKTFSEVCDQLDREIWQITALPDWLPKFPPGSVLCSGFNVVGVDDPFGLRIVHGQAVFASQLLHELIDVVCFWPHAGNDDVARRAIDFAAPRTVIVVADLVVWKVVALWVLGNQLLVEGIDGRVRRRALGRSLTKRDVQLSSLRMTQPLVRVPNSKVEAHGKIAA
jgi:hypothetical protein